MNPSIKTHGFKIINSNEINELNNLKRYITNFLSNKFKLNNKDPDDVLNNIHNYANLITDRQANDLVLETLKELSDKFDFSEIVYQSFGEEIRNLLGPDLHAQKNNNIVFQSPNSNRYSELHSDAPPNSEFELVVWVPLVNCYGTKSFFMVPLEDSFDLIKKYKSKNFSNWNEFKSKALEKANHFEINYSQALIFWTGMIHGSLENKTNESRWCLNVRYKNLFAPCGQHDPLTYYRIFRKSVVTDLALSKKW